MVRSGVASSVVCRLVDASVFIETLDEVSCRRDIVSRFGDGLLDICSLIDKRANVESGRSDTEFLLAERVEDVESIVC